MAPAIRLTPSAAALEVVGWVESEPPETSAASAFEKPIIPPLSWATPDIWADSASLLAVSASVFTSYCAATRPSTSALVSIPDPIPSVDAIEVIGFPVSSSCAGLAS